MAVNPNKYSLYTQRDAEKQYVDWGKVAQDVTKGITTIAAERTARKAELDKLTNEAIENLSQVPDVESQDAGTMIINASDMSKKNLQIQADLMKRGLISPKDFKLFMEKQKTGYSSYSTAIKQWDKWYQNAKTRIDEDKASAGEIYNNTSLESFGNLQNKVLITNPANGQLQLVEMSQAPDGTYTKMPDLKKQPYKVVSPHAINLRMNMESEKKVLVDEAKKLVEPMGRIIRNYVDETGKSFSREGFRYRQGKDGMRTYDQWLDSSADALTATNDDQMQILAGQGYHIAQSVDEFKEKHGDDVSKMIKVSYASGSPVYSLVDANGKEIKGGLEKEARKLARFALDDQIDDMTKYDDEDKRPEAVKDNESRLVGFMDDVNAIVSDDKQSFEASAQDRIAAMNDLARQKGTRLIDNIDRSDRQIIITYQDGSKEYVDRYDEDGNVVDARTQSQRLWRYITNEGGESFKKAADLYEQEKDGGFRGAGRDATEEENRTFLATQRAEKVLKDKGLKPGDEDYEKELNIEIAKQDKNITPKELAAIKRRVAKGENIVSYSSLPSIGYKDGKPEKTSTSALTIGTKDGQEGQPLTGTDIIRNKLGDKNDRDTLQNDATDEEFQKVSSEVLKAYLPKSIRDGAKVEYQFDGGKDKDGKEIPDLIISYYDAKGQLQELKIDTPRGGYWSYDGRITATKLNDLLYDASVQILDSENERRSTRNQGDVSKNVVKFN